MATVLTSTKNFNFKFTLENNSSGDIQERTLSIETNATSENAETRANAFIENYMANYSNATLTGSGSGAPTLHSGSLIQPSGWLDYGLTSESSTGIESRIPYICTGIKAEYVEKNTYTFE